MISKTSSWATFERTSRLSSKLLHRLRLHEAHNIYITSRDIQHLICQVCKPFVLTADPAAFARHQAEKHGGWHPAPLPRFVPQSHTARHSSIVSPGSLSIYYTREDHIGATRHPGSCQTHSNPTNASYMLIHCACPTATPGRGPVPQAYYSSSPPSRGTKALLQNTF